MENEATRRQKITIYVGRETNLREFAVLLPDRRRDRTRRINVCQSLVLADDLFRRRPALPGRGAGGVVETSRLPG